MHCNCLTIIVRRLHDDGDDDGGSPYTGHHTGFQPGDGSTPGPEVMPDGSLRYLSQPPILKAGQVPRVSPQRIAEQSCGQSGVSLYAQIARMLVKVRLTSKCSQARTAQALGNVVTALRKWPA